jgi:putative hemolysin
MQNKRGYRSGLLVLLLASGCSNSNPESASADSGRQTKAAATNAAHGVADPSVKYCLKQGYKSQAVMRDGIPQSYLCVDAESGKKCDSWAYFRGQCELGAAQ